LACLVRRLNEQDAGAKVVTWGSAQWENIEPYSDIPVVELGLRGYHSPLQGWRRLEHFLKARAPCILVTGFDHFNCCLSATLPPSVKVVSVVHSDEDVYYDVTVAAGSGHDRIVAVSSAIREEVCRRSPELGPRTSVIHHGVDCFATWPVRKSAANQPLRVLYTGRITHYQKRILLIPAIAAAATVLGVPLEITVVGLGCDDGVFDRFAAPWIRRGIIKRLPAEPAEKVLQRYAENDVFLLPSEFEGLPISLLEAMSRGCVPVVSDIRSGIPEVVREGENGYRIALDDVEGFAKRLAELHHDPARRLRMAEEAHRTIWLGGFRSEDMARRWMELFQEMERPSSPELVPHRRKTVDLPPFLAVRPTDRLPPQIRRLAKGSIRRLASFARRWARG
jgi:glycosyltransferase involved in cell wall biosynthesis